jgi:hypothetical protein
MSQYFDKDNYVGVHERIAKFREEHKQGMITTFREKTADGEYFKAVVFRNYEEAKLFPSLAAASGHADVTENGKKASEKAETVAIGRALAILGYEVKKGLASAEEIEQFQEREEGASRFGSSKKEDAKEEKKGGWFNRSSKEKKEEEKVAAPEASEEEAPKSSRFSSRSSESKETKSSEKEEAKEESSNEDSSEDKTPLRSSRPFKSGSRFTRGAGA